MALDGFCFAVKANRFLTHIRRLIDPAPTIERFFRGALRLGERLGPVLYQLPPFFERTVEHAERFEAFLALLPRGPDHVVWAYFNDDIGGDAVRNAAAFRTLFHTGD